MFIIFLNMASLGASKTTDFDRNDGFEVQISLAIRYVNVDSQI